MLRLQWGSRHERSAVLVLAGAHGLWKMSGITLALTCLSQRTLWGSFIRATTQVVAFQAWRARIRKRCTAQVAGFRTFAPLVRWLAGASLALGPNERFQWFDSGILGSSGSL